ncbi:MAG TPA: NAD-dependent epimerase/dehydratase family protein [Flavitalea sp.]|nr:NAD-dependent epimerase/dehydratase family protein [Flavitalea sp.]
MLKPVVGITGANGFIGSYLSDYLAKKGYSIIQFARNFKQNITTQRKYDLEDLISKDLFTDVDVLIHCAFIKNEVNPLAEQINYNATERLITASREQGVKKVIFFSSVSAHNKAVSAYGKSKFRIHNLLDSKRDLIVQSGLVIGDGGLFKKLYEYSSSHKFIPLIDGGRQVIQLIAIDDVADFIDNAIINDLTGTHVMVNNERLTYRQIFESIARLNQSKLYFIPLPGFFLKKIITSCNYLNIPIPVTKENLLGFQKLKLFEPSPQLKASKSLVQKLFELKN